MDDDKALIAMYTSLVCKSCINQIKDEIEGGNNKKENEMVMKMGLMFMSMNLNRLRLSREELRKITRECLEKEIVKVDAQIDKLIEGDLK